MKKILVFLLTVSSLAAIAYPVKSNEAMKSLAFTNNSTYIPSAADYVQDGLIAMWDGIENTGWGSHSSNTLIWKDLVGNLDLFYTGSLGNMVGYWESDCFRAVSKGRYAWMNEPSQEIVDILLSNSPMTIEGVFSIEDTVANNSVMLNISDGSRSDGMMFCAYNSLSLFFSMNDAWSGNRVSVDVGRAFDYAGKKIFSSCLYGNGEIVAKVIVGEEVRKTAKGSSMEIAKTPTKLTLGNYCWASINSRAAIGKYNCFRIYNRALTEEEIAYNYEIDRIRFNIP